MMHTMQQHTVPPVAEEIRDTLVQTFGDRLQSVLLYGSSLISDQYWDLDMLVLLCAHDDHTRDLEGLKQIRKIYQDQVLDLQLYYPSELRGPDTFSLDAHGAFFYPLLAHAHVLHGSNPFRAEHASEAAVVVSLLNRIQRYVFQARQEYVHDRRHTKDRNPHYHTKHVRRCMYDLLLMRLDHVESASIDDLFQATFPTAFVEADWATLGGTESSITTHMPLYETIYRLALETAHRIVPANRQRPLRGTGADMVFEYILPTAKTPRRAIILIDGIPRVPDLTSTMSLMAAWGYAVYAPRLIGTWESPGTFLDHDPANDIIAFAHALRDGRIHNNGTPACDHTTLIGVSFGATLALAASTSPHVDRVIACSPFPTLADVRGIDTLPPYLATHYAGAYRSSPDAWEQSRVRDWLSLPARHAAGTLAPKKCQVFYGAHDPEIDAMATAAFCTNAQIPCRELPEGHLALHKGLRTLGPILYEHLARAQ